MTLRRIAFAGPAHTAGSTGQSWICRWVSGKIFGMKMKKGRNDFASTLFQFSRSAKSWQARALEFAPCISAPTAAWAWTLPGTPGSLPRDTSCHCRPLRSREADFGRLWIWSRRSDDRREPNGPRPGIDRSWRTPDSNSHSSVVSFWRNASLHGAPDSFSCGYQPRYRSCPRQCNVIKRKSFAV
jgi:hypothetical protein